MIVKQRENREQVEIFSIEEFVPADHLLRKIDSAIDFTHIYDIVEDLYCADNGRPSIDPAKDFMTPFPFYFPPKTVYCLRLC